MSNLPGVSGQGFEFETEVGAHYLIQLLLGGMPTPIAYGKTVKVSFQQRQIQDALLDDLIVRADLPDGADFAISLQLKRTIKWSESPQSTFVNVLKDCWEEFQKCGSGPTEHFFGIVYATPLASEYEAREVLAMARNKSCEADFFMHIDKFSSDKHRKFLTTLRGALKNITKTVEDVTLWRFLRCFVLLKFQALFGDNTDSFRNEDLINTVVLNGQMQHVYDLLRRKSAELRMAAGTCTFDDIKEYLRSRVTIDWSSIEAIRNRKSRSTSSLRVSLGNLPDTRKELFGRDKELSQLDMLIKESSLKAVSLVGFGGIGKTAIVNSWIDRSRELCRAYGIKRVYAWSFYNQGVGGNEISNGTDFLSGALAFFRDASITAGTQDERVRRLLDLLNEEGTLLVLDGLELLQIPSGSKKGRINDRIFRQFLRDCCFCDNAKLIVTSRLELPELVSLTHSHKLVKVLKLNKREAIELLRQRGIMGSAEVLAQVCIKDDFNPLLLNLTASYLVETQNVDVVSLQDATHTCEDTDYVMESYHKWFGASNELGLLYMVGSFDRPVPVEMLELVRREVEMSGCGARLAQLDSVAFRNLISDLCDRELLQRRLAEGVVVVDAHPLVREYFGKKCWELNPVDRKMLFEKLLSILLRSASDGMPLGMAKGHAATVLLQTYNRLQAVADMLDESQVLFNVEWAIWAYYQMRANTEEAIKYAERLSTTSNRSNLSEHIAEAYQVMANTKLYNESKLDESVLYWNSAIDKLHVSGITPGGPRGWAADTLINSLSSVAIPLALTGSDAIAVARSEAAMQLLSNINDPFSTTVACVYAGWLYEILGKTDKSVQFAEKAISIGAGFATWHAAAKLLKGIGLCRLGDRENAIELCESGLAEWRQAEVQLFVPLFLSWVAEAHFRCGSQSRARDYSLAAVAAAEKTGQKWSLPAALTSAGVICNDPSFKARATSIALELGMKTRRPFLGIAL